MSKEGELMADPYASPAGGAVAPPPAAPSSSGFSLPGFSQGSAADDLHLNVSEPSATPDFLFEDSYDQNFRRSWGERLTYHVGGAYLIGACTPRTSALCLPALLIGRQAPNPWSPPPG